MTKNMKKIVLSLLTALTVFPAVADFSLVQDGTSKCAVIRPKGASQTEVFAARELSTYLKKITGAEVNVLRRPDAQLYIFTSARWTTPISGCRTRQNP